MITSQLLPRQRLSYSFKSQNDFQWVKDNFEAIELDYWSGQSMSGERYDKSGIRRTLPKNSYEKMLTNYEYYNNVIDQSAFDSDFNPMGISVGQHKDDVKAYNKIPNKVEVLGGEASERPFNYRPFAISVDGINEKLASKDKLVVDYFTGRLEALRFKAQQEAQAQIAAQLEGREPTEEEMAMIEEQAQVLVDRLMPPEEIDKLTNVDFLSQNEKIAGKILDYHYYKNTIYDKRAEGFKHGLISAIEALWVGVEQGQEVIKPINSLGLLYHKSNETKFIEKGAFAGFATKETTADILDNYGDYLKDSVIRQLEGTYTGKESHAIKNMTAGVKYDHNTLDRKYAKSLAGSYADQGSHSPSSRSNYDNIVVKHLEWRSQSEIGFVETTNEYGDTEMFKVSEDFYVPDYAVKRTETGRYGRKDVYYDFDGMSLQWKWIPEIWEATKIDEDFYCCIGPKEHQFRSAENPMDVKLGYHGAVYNAMNADPVSMVSRMIPFQQLYLVTVHKLKKLIAKDRGQSIVVDTSQIPKELGLEKMMYYLDEMDVQFVDPLRNAEQPGSSQRGAVGNSFSRSNMQHIMNYVHLMNALDDQIAEVAGVTPQREGASSAHEAVTNAQQSIIKSMNITEPLFSLHDEIWRRGLESLVSLTMDRWSGKNIVKQYVGNDGQNKILEIRDDEIQNSDMGLFLADGGKENKIFKQLGEITRMVAGSDKAKLSDMIKMLNASSVKDLTSEIEQSERTREQREAELQQQASQLEQQKLEAAEKLMDKEQAHELKLKQMELDNKIELAQIDSFKFQQDQDINDNNVPDQLEIEKLSQQLHIENKKLDIKREEIKSKERIEDKKVKAAKAKKPS